MPEAKKLWGLVLIPFLGLMNVVRGGWPYIVDAEGKKPWWKKSDLFWALGHLPLAFWIGWSAIPAAVGAWAGGVSRWGPYIGATLKGRWDDGLTGPKPGLKWIDTPCRPLLRSPTLWGVATLTLRGLQWSAAVAALLAPAIWYFDGEWRWMLGVIGYALMGPAFISARLWPVVNQRWRVGEAVLGACAGLFWCLAILWTG